MSYKVWVFKRTRDCYDCGQVEGISDKINADPIVLSDEEFKHFNEGAKVKHDAEVLFLYMSDEHNAGYARSKVDEFIKAGQLEEQKRELSKQKAAERAKKQKEKELKKTLCDLAREFEVSPATISRIKHRVHYDM